jgi:predicted DNA-binding transcriptional regulator AlpA
MVESVHESARRSERKALHTVAENRLLTPEDVAAITGLSVETLAQWRSQKRGPPYLKISRNCVRYRQSDLDGWVAERIVRTDLEASERSRR